VAADEPGRFCDAQGDAYSLGPSAIDASSIATAESVTTLNSTAAEAHALAARLDPTR